MSNKQFEFVGVPVIGYEEDYLETINSNIGMSELLVQSGVERISTQEKYGFEYDDGGYFDKYKKQYLLNHPNNKCPPIFKIKMSVEVEQLSEEEAIEFWRNKKE